MKRETQRDAVNLLTSGTQRDSGVLEYKFFGDDRREGHRGTLLTY